MSAKPTIGDITATAETDQTVACLRVTVRCHMWLCRYLSLDREGSVCVEVPYATSLADLLTLLAVPEEEVSVALVDGTPVACDFRLQRNSLVDLLPVIAGG